MSALIAFAALVLIARTFGLAYREALTAERYCAFADLDRYARDYGCA